MYGSDTLQDVVSKAKAEADKSGSILEDFQANSEGAIVDRIHQARVDDVHGIIINAG